MAVDTERFTLTKAYLAQSGFDAVVASSPTQVLLLTGYWPVMGGSIALFTKDGEVTVIAPQDECDLARSTISALLVPYTSGGLDDLRSPVEALRQPLHSQLLRLKLSNARIGIQSQQGVQPASYAVNMEFRASFVDLLRTILPHATFSSCDDLFETMQARKTGVELTLMQTANDVAATGFEEAALCIKPGLRETEIAAAVHAAFSRSPQAEGLQRSYGFFFCMSGPNSFKASAAYARTRQRVVKEGDLVMIHANTCADGYWTDLTRTYTAGTPSRQQLRMRAAIDEARTAALHAIRPGVIGRDVDRAARSVLESCGFGPAFKHATGHGVGFAAANANGRPRIHPLSPDVLEEGMTFNIEPAIYLKDVGGMRHCDVVSVKSDGASVSPVFEGCMKHNDTIASSRVQVFTVPTDAPEADGTYAWDSTTMVLVTLAAGNKQGIGYTYADQASGRLAQTLLEKVVVGKEVFAHGAILQAMYRYVRNLGETGISTMAISAIDNALWDLRARLLDVPAVSLLGRVRESIPVYGSGGFTCYDDRQLSQQLGGWADQGIGIVKMKVGTNPADDPRRVEVARKAIGDATQLFVDANGAYTVTQALEVARLFAEHDVRWFEEPVSSDNLAGLREIRMRAPVGMDIAAGEYGYTAWYFRTMIDAEAVSVLQADATRCGGISGFLDVASLCWAANVPLSSHCGPSMHLHVCCSVPRAIHMEYFHDHVRIERMFFDGFCEPSKGMMHPDLTRPGFGLELKEKDASQYLV